MNHIESTLSMKELFQFPTKYSQESADKLAKAESLWNHMRPNVPFDETQSMLYFRENAVLPGLTSDNEEILMLAIDVAQEMANQLTNLKRGGRKEIILPACVQADALSIDGKIVPNQAGGNNYCGGTGRNETDRRGRMTALRFNLSA
jgi:hypothetical protein